MLTEKKGQFVNFVGLLPDDGRVLAAPAPTAAGGSYGGGRKGGSFDSVGAQIGNALTNAAAISPAGTTVAQLGDTAESIIKLGEILKQRHAAGAYAAPGATPAPVAVPLPMAAPVQQFPAPAVPMAAPAAVLPIVPAPTAAPAPIAAQAAGEFLNKQTGEATPVVNSDSPFSDLLGK
jgi:hypothetical protein